MEKLELKDDLLEYIKFNILNLIPSVSVTKTHANQLVVSDGETNIQVVVAYNGLTILHHTEAIENFSLLPSSKDKSYLDSFFNYIANMYNDDITQIKQFLIINQNERKQVKKFIENLKSINRLNKVGERLLELLETDTEPYLRYACRHLINYIKFENEDEYEEINKYIYKE